MTDLLMLAQEQPFRLFGIFGLWQILAFVALVGLIVFWVVYRKRQM